jgi:hypothetical protein
VLIAHLTPKAFWDNDVERSIVFGDAIGSARARNDGNDGGVGEREMRRP